MNVWMVSLEDSDNSTHIKGIFNNKTAAKATVDALGVGEHDGRPYLTKFAVLSDPLLVEHALWAYWQRSQEGPHFEFRELSRVYDEDDDSPYPECESGVSIGCIFAAEGTDRERVKREFRKGVLALAEELGVESLIQEIDETLLKVP